MNLGFKFKYDEMQQNDPTGSATPETNEDASYSGASHIRNLCFILLDGKKIFLNYSYLVSGEYIPELSSIVLTFTSHVIILFGIHLDTLFNELMAHFPKTITCTDARYNAVNGDDKPLVNEIKITTSKSGD